MTIDLKQAGESVQALVRQYRSVLQVGEALALVGDLEIYRADAENQLLLANSRRDAAQIEMVAAEQRLTEANAAVSAVYDEVNRIVGEAEVQAADIRGKAQADADNAIAAAFAQVAELKAAAQTELTAAYDAKRVLDAEIATATALLAELEAELAELRKRIG